MEPGKWSNLSCAHTAKKCEEHKLQNSTCLGFFWLRKEANKKKQKKYAVLVLNT